MLQRRKSVIALSSVLSILILVTGCQPKHEQKSEAQNQSETQQNTSTKQNNEVIHAKTVAVKLPQVRACDESGCTDYDFQTVETNHPWINAYFIERIQKMDPVAFQKKDAKEENQPSKEQDVNRATIMVRYVGQNEHLATFEMMNYIYTVGSAHGMYHNEYVNFDLNKKKRIALQDLVSGGAESKVTDALYNANSMWLEDHNITREKLQLSDNFYYGAQGIVFVYPLYELASYAEGMSELVLPYHMVNGLIKSEYLPNLPKYKQD